MSSETKPEGSVIFHAADQGVVDAAIKDDGQIVYSCRECDKSWRRGTSGVTELGGIDLKRYQDLFKEARFKLGFR